MKPEPPTGKASGWQARKADWNERLEHVRWLRLTFIILSVLALYCAGVWVAAVIGWISEGEGIDPTPNYVDQYMVWFTFLFTAVLGGILLVAFPSVTFYIVFPVLTGDSFEGKLVLSATLVAAGGVLINELLRAVWGASGQSSHRPSVSAPIETICQEE